MLFQRPTRMLHVGVAIAATLGAVACSTMSHRTEAQRQTDNETAARVASALNADPTLYARHIDVRAYNGVVHLGGYVWNNTDLYAAQQIAESVPGVTQVVDDMELERGGSNNSGTSR